MPLYIDAGAKVLTLGALVLGGGVGYLRYLRGRVFHAKLDLELEFEVVPVGSGLGLKVAATVMNAGTCRVTFPAESVQEIQVSACYPAAWAASCATSVPPTWDAALYYKEDFGSVFADRLMKELEPGQRFVRSLLVPPPVE